MLRWLVALVVMLVGVAMARSSDAAGGERWTLGAAPAWVTPIPVPEARAAGPSDGTTGRRYLLFDFQTRVGSAVESYVHWAEQITNETGLSAASQVKIGFDPTYETLVIHSVRIRRGSETLERMLPDTVKLVQREPNLEAQTFDGQQTALLFVSDLRVGDVLDVAYTTRGADPTLEGHFTSGFSFGASEPIAQLHTRVVLAGGRKAHVLIHSANGERSAWATTPIVRGDETEYVWNAHDVPAYLPEENVPSWYEAAPWVQFSDFDSWSDVAALAHRLFTTPVPESGPLFEWVTEQRRSAPDDETFLRKVIRFVQDEVRYVAIEVGMARRRPNPPETVFARRYGDCKDKTALLVAIVRAAGLRASPVLVSTSSGRTLGEMEPTPAVFDHAIVMIASRDRDKPYWVDGTIDLQGGGLARHLTSPFERGLVVDDGEALTELPPPVALVPELRIHDRFTLPDPAKGDEATLEVERTYSGFTGDAMRRSLRSQTTEELGKAFIALYTDDFPAIREARPLEQEDDRDGDVLRVSLHFAIPKIWSASADGQSEVTVTSRPIGAMLTRPPNRPRKAPWAVGFPLRVKHQIDLDLPTDLALTPDEKNVSDDVFHAHFISSYEEKRRRVTYTYELTTEAPFVAAARIEEHKGKVDELQAMLPRKVWLRSPALPGEDGLNWSVFVALCGILPFVGWGLWRAYRWDPKRPKPLVPPDPTRGGIGGWMILLAINVTLAPVARAWDFVRTARIGLSLATWHSLMTPGLATYRPALGVLMVVEMIAIFTTMLYAIVVVVLFYKKRRTFPVHFTIAAVGTATLGLVDAVLVEVLTDAETSDQFATVARLMVFALIWVSYVWRSERAANTFVERYSKRPKRRVRE